MAVDSGTYDPETIARHQKIADMLLKQAAAPREIRSRLQGFGQLGEGLIAGLTSRGVDQEQKDARAEALTQAIAAFGGGQSPAAVAPAAMPVPAGAAPGTAVADNQVPIGTTQAPSDVAIPRGLRNNNPLNIEEGAFTQGQPGFAGSDGRFAKFQTPEQGIGAANALLDSYGRRGLNTPSAIVSRWAPSSDGNNTPAYAMAIAKQLGIGPNDPIPANLRPQLIAAMGQHENGRPIGDVAAALAGPQAGAGGVPQGATPPVPQQVAQNAPAGAAGPPNRDAVIRALMNKWVPAGLQGALMQQLVGDKVQYQTTPDGDILAMDPHGRVPPKVVYKATAKPIPIAEGGSLYDPATKTTIAGSGAKDTTDEKNYAAYAKGEKSEGRSPKLFGDWLEGIKKASSQNIAVNNTVNPIVKGVGERFNDTMDAAKASIPQIQGIHEARRALDQGAITGLGADPKLFLAKAANLFGLDEKAAANTEVARSAIGNSVLAKAKTLGANPSNTDRDYIEKVVGGQIQLEEPSIRRLLDMQEKWARDAIKRANTEGGKLLKAQPKELENIGPLLTVDEPPSYEDFLKANPVSASQAAPAAAPKIRRFNPATGKIE